MAEPISIQQLKDASLDVKSLEELVNGDELTDVEARLGETYPSIKKAVRLIMENGLLGAQAFKTYDLMVASVLADGDYAIVTDGDNSNLNGIYRKEGGAWVYSQYNNFYDASLNPILSAMIAISDDSASKIAVDNNLDIAWGVVDRDNNVALAVTNSGELMVAGLFSGSQKGTVVIFMNASGLTTNASKIIFSDAARQDKAIYAQNAKLLAFNAKTTMDVTAVDTKILNFVTAYDGTNDTATIYADGKSSAGAMSGAGAPTGDANLGTWTDTLSNNNYIGYIGHVMIFDEDLSKNKVVRDLLTEYAKRKYRTDVK